MARWKATQPTHPAPSAALSARLAKLTPPRVGRLVGRARLYARLDKCRDAAMIWVAALPGAGKTSLVSSYLEARERPTLWMHIDDADSDPATFFHFLTLAAAEHQREPRLLPRYTAEDTGQVGAFSRRYFRELYASLPGGFVLVYDNVQQAARGDQLHDALAAQIEEQPSGFQVIAISRAAPPAALARARAARALQLIDWSDLRLQDNEVAELAANQGILDQEIHAQLATHAQGWAAGLVLMLERIRQDGTIGRPTQVQADVAVSVGAIQAGLETIFDYFATQVLQACEPAVRDVLLCMSYLPRLTAAWAAQLSGEGRAGDLLEDFYRRNLFVDRRFGSPIFYQFHDLFRAYLQEQAERSLTPARQRGLKLQAAKLLRGGGHYTEAFSLYAATEEWDEAVALVLDQAESMVASGRHQTLGEWMETLPRSLPKSGWLTYWAGVAESGTDPAASRVQLERSLAIFTENHDVAGQIHAIASMLGSWWSERSDLRWLEPYTARLADLLANDAGLELKLVATGLIALARARLMIRPTDPRLAHYVQRLTALPIDALKPEHRLGAGTCQVQFYWGIGDSRAAEAAARRTLEVSMRADVPPWERLWFWFWLMTHEVYMVRPKAGREVMRLAQELEDQSRMAPPFLDFVRWNVTLELQQGRIREARALLETELIPHLPKASLFTRACIELETIRCAVEERRFEEAIAQGQRTVALCRDGGHHWLMIAGGLGLCSAQALHGDIAGARATLAELRAVSGEALPILSASVDAYAALVELKAGSRDAARTLLSRAIASRRGTGYPWGPGWNRPAIAELVAFGALERIEPDTMRQFVAGLQLEPPTPDVVAWPWPVVLRVLDGFQFEIDGKSPIKRGKLPKRLFEILQLIAARGKEGITIDTLCDEVWPDAEGDAARSALDTGLSRLRHWLRHDNAIFVQNGRVTLNANIVSLDLVHFERHHERMAVLEVGSPEWIRHAEDALALYRRPLLDGTPLIERVGSMSERWRDKRNACAKALANVYRAAGRRRDGVRVLDDAIKVAPEWEQGYALLLGELIELGDSEQLQVVIASCRIAYRRRGLLLPDGLQRWLARAETVRPPREV